MKITLELWQWLLVWSITYTLTKYLKPILLYFKKVFINRKISKKNVSKMIGYSKKGNMVHYETVLMDNKTGEILRVMNSIDILQTDLKGSKN